MSQLPEARIATSNDLRTLLNGIAVALAIGVTAAMLEANVVGGALVLALVGGLWLHRRYIVDARKPATRAATPSRSVREQTLRVRSLVTLTIAGIVLSSWFVATVNVDWSLIGIGVLAAALTRAGRA